MKKEVASAVFPPVRGDQELEVHTNKDVAKSACDNVLQPDDLSISRYRSQSYRKDARLLLNIAFGRIRHTQPMLDIHSLPLSTQAECFTGD